MRHTAVSSPLLRLLHGDVGLVARLAATTGRRSVAGEPSTSLLNVDYDLRPELGSIPFL